MNSISDVASETPIQSGAPLPPSADEKPADPEAVLAAKKNDLKVVQTEIEVDNKKVGLLNADIQSLQAKIAERGQALGGYDPEALTKQLNNATSAIAQKISIAEATLKENKAAIDQKISEFFKALDDQKKGVSQAWANSQQAAQNAAAADADAKSKQSAYDATKQIPKDIDAALKDVKSMLDQAAKAEVSNDFTALYVYAKEASKVADGLEIPSVSKLTEKLNNDLTAAETGRETAVVKKAEADAKLAAYNDAKKTYDAAWASRRADLLKLLETPKT